MSLEINTNSIVKHETNSEKKKETVCFLPCLQFLLGVVGLVEIEL